MTEQMKLPHDHHGDASLEAHLIEALQAAGDFSMAANVFKQLSDSSRLRAVRGQHLLHGGDEQPGGIAPSAPASPKRAD